MLPLIIAAAALALVGCTSSETPENEENRPNSATPPPRANPRTDAGTDVRTVASSATSSAASGDRFQSGPTPQQSLRELRAGTQFVSDTLCEWYNTEFEQEFCRTSLGLFDLYLQESEPPPNQ